MKKLLRYMGIIFISAAVAATGYIFDAVLLNKIRQMEKMERLTEYINNRIQYTQADIFSIFTNAAKERTFHSLEFLLHFSDLKSDWSKTKIEGCIPAGYVANELVTDFFAGLGQSDYSGQLEHCAVYKNLFNEKRCMFQEEYNNKGKVYRSLGLFAAAGIAVFLI